MKKYIVFFIVFTAVIYGQKPDSTLNRWIPSMVTGLNISQITFKDWIQGGANSLTWTVTGDLSVLRKSENWNLSSRLKATYGRTSISGSDFRTNNNDFYFDIVAALKLGWAVDPFFSNTVRTQLTAGYNYAVTPAVQISDFFDPGYITQSIGFTYDKMKFFKSRLGIASQEVFTDKYTKVTDKPLTTKVERFKFETGVESVTDGEIKLDGNIVFKSLLRLFTRFESLDVWDVRWDSTIIAKVNSWLNVNFAYLLIYEKAQSVRTQMKEALQVGIVYTVL